MTTVTLRNAAGAEATLTVSDNPPAMTRRYVKNVRALARHYQKGT